jgi:hypothetical protein
MRVAFIVSVVSEYKLVAPVIDEVMRRGWEAQCWLNHARPRTGPKGYLFPSESGTPVFRYGQPTVRAYQNAGELRARLEEMAVDAVVSTGSVESDTQGTLPARYPLWITVQGRLDTFINQTPEALMRSDVLALQTRWWTDWAAAYWDVSPDMWARLAPRIAEVGCPEFDARRLLDPPAIRHRWGIPADRPVIVLLPFPQGVGTGSFWPQRIFGEPRRLRRVANVLRHRRFEYWRQAWRADTDRDVIRALRDFCDREHAWLLVKSREKTPIPEYTRAAADSCVYDESYYPPTILEAMSIATACVSFYSAGVFEAADLAVPNLCVTFAADDYLAPGATSRRSFERFFTPEEGGAFQFDGVSTTCPPDEAVATLGSLSLRDFRMSPEARARYVERFNGPDDDQASVRLADVIQRRADARRAADQAIAARV